MFEGCGSFNGDVSSWDISNATTLNEMFQGCFSFNGNVSVLECIKCDKFDLHVLRLRFLQRRCFLMECSERDGRRRYAERRSRVRW